MLEEVPDVDYAAIGGLASADRAHPRRDRAAAAPPRALPRARARAARAACCCTARPAAARRSSPRPSRTRSPTPSGADRSYFLSVKGPELLNKYVGETERYIRTIFERAPQQGRRRRPRRGVLRRDGRAVPRARLGRVERHGDHDRARSCSPSSTASRGSANVIVIGASNREDMIDPAILRPGPPGREDRDHAPRPRRRRPTSSAST